MASFSVSSGFITDGNSFLLGNVLLRQIRIPGAIAFPNRVSPQEQVKPSHQDLEDTKNYGVNWRPPETNTTPSDSIWHYQNQKTLGGYPIRGEFATYSGGGYVVRLGRNSSTAIRWASLSPKQEDQDVCLSPSGRIWGPIWIVLTATIMLLYCLWHLETLLRLWRKSIF